jgi:hypothetical protein
VCYLIFVHYQTVDDLIMKPTAGQSRSLVVFAGVAGLLAVVFAVLGGVVDARAWIYAGVAVFAAVLFGFAYFVKAGDFTEVTANGIRNRTLGRFNDCAWGDIEDIAVRSRTTNGVSTAVVIVTRSKGRPFGLASPVDGGAMKDAEFALKFAQITQRWQAYKSVH